MERSDRLTIFDLLTLQSQSVRLH